MTTAIATRDESAFSSAQVELIKRTIAKGSSDDELKLFLAQCERTGLDPFDRQIYFIKRKQWNSRTNNYDEIGQTQTSIDGFRVVAERTGEMDGQEVAWCDETGQWTDIWLKKTPPFAARVLAYRKGCSKPFPGIARYDEYVQTSRDGKPNSMWAKMAANQLAKCAEALSLRKAFPKQLSGLYTRDEMGQAENEGVVVEAPKPPAKTKEVLIAGNEHAKDGDPVYARVPTEDEGPSVLEPEREGPVDSVTVVRVGPGRASAKGEITLSSGLTFLTYVAQLVTLAEQLCQEGAPVHIETKRSTSGNEYLIGIKRAELPMPAEPPGAMVDLKDLPF